MKTSKGETLAYIVLFSIIFYLFFSSCTSKKKIDYKKNPHYPYIIER
jgi:hypothetical protein